MSANTKTEAEGPNGVAANGLAAGSSAAGSATPAPASQTGAGASASASALDDVDMHNGPNGPPPTVPAPGASGVEGRVMTAAKDISLKDFLNKMDDYAPIIPDAVTSYYMTKAGLPPPPQTDPRLARLLALATQKFIADIAADAYQYSRVRASNSSANNPMGGAAGVLPGVGGAAGAVGAAGGKDQGKGAAALGVQRPGFGGGGQGNAQNRTVLTMEDLGMAVGEYGVNVKRGEFYR